jgi:AcrR family transcriptional regulator
VKPVVKKGLTPGPRDERGVLAARILSVARKEFAETGWAGTTIRAIARAADVDPALVYHYFGSKELLLDAATNPPQKWLEGVANTWQTPTSQLGRALLELLMASWTDDDVGPTLRAVLQTAAHEQTTRDKLRMIVERSLMGVSQLGVDERDRMVRSGLIASQMMGFALMRYVWKIEPVASMSEDEVIAAIAPNLQRYIEGDLTGTPETQPDSRVRDTSRP